jgi:hypothetical protein
MPVLRGGVCVAQASSLCCTECGALTQARCLCDGGGACATNLVTPLRIAAEGGGGGAALVHQIGGVVFV